MTEEALTILWQMRLAVITILSVMPGDIPSSNDLYKEHIRREFKERIKTAIEIVKMVADKTAYKPKVK